MDTATNSRLDELGLKKNASPELIRAAYKRLALKNHPDNGGNPEDY